MPMSCWKLRVANTASTRRLRDLKPGTLESEFERSLANLRIRDPGITKGKGESMNFGVIGPGDIGEVIIRKLRDADYPVKMANARGPESLKDLAAKTGAIPASLEQG